MNPTIEALILSICALGLRITSAGQFHVLVDLTGHVESVYVRIYPADHQYIGAGSKPPLFKADIRYGHGKPHPWDNEDPASKPIAELEQLKTALAAYLPENQPQEVAA
ncbi:hypothetical protein CXP40_16200 [Pseudomonas sp. YY-1]|uniref:hypothetical protein n=1 Tax=Pseudomonas sp. YY-1 TaxID=2058659 RepID=UPI000CB52229|nr:hypothetical protein [Pseudomonas sp. YY-1]PKQ40317.1 hypothetical protein CXP40_16200 [Pseudomonas sp. YY-1]